MNCQKRFFKTYDRAETGLAEWIERRFGDWEVPGSIPVKGMYLGCGHKPGGGCAGGS